MTSQPNMTPLEKELRRLAGSKRSRRNADAIGQQLVELTEHAESITDFLAAVDSARQAVGELTEALDSVDEDNPLVSDVDEMREAVTAFVKAIPSGEDESLSDMIQEAQSAFESAQEVAEDREYGAQERDEAWYEMCDALKNIADTLGQ